MQRSIINLRFIKLEAALMVAYTDLQQPATENKYNLRMPGTYDPSPIKLNHTGKRGYWQPGNSPKFKRDELYIQKVSNRDEFLEAFNRNDKTGMQASGFALRFANLLSLDDVRCHKTTGWGEDSVLVFRYERTWDELAELEEHDRYGATLVHISARQDHRQNVVNDDASFQRVLPAMKQEQIDLRKQIPFTLWYIEDGEQVGNDGHDGHDVGHDDAQPSDDLATSASHVTPAQSTVANPAATPSSTSSDSLSEHQDHESSQLTNNIHEDDIAAAEDVALSAPIDPIAPSAIVTTNRSDQPHTPHQIHDESTSLQSTRRPRQRRQFGPPNVHTRATVSTQRRHERE